MRYLKYVALLAVLMVPLGYLQAQVRVGAGVAVGPGFVAAEPPVCAYGYYPYYPYACAPYGYYAPTFFVNGVFIGAGPWYHWGHPAGWWAHPGWGYRPGFVGRRFEGREFERRGFESHGFENRRFENHGFAARGSGGGFHRGGGFHGGGR
jgi:hypothetical protein